MVHEGHPFVMEDSCRMIHNDHEDNTFVVFSYRYLNISFQLVYCRDCQTCESMLLALLLFRG